VVERSQPSAAGASILARRARALARPDATAVEQDVVAAIILVRVGKDRLGLPAHGMQGVYEDVRITPVMGTPPWIAGVAQVRGELLSVVHLSRWLGQSATAERPVVAVLSGERGSLGILVDEVLGSRDLAPGEISDLLTRQAERDKRPISAVTNDLVAVLDLERFFAEPDLVVGRRVGDGG
jgi:purine-binding chemotaxis protein CheW